jgi:DNA repair exonuclease SbcCD nuclease subunit
MVKFLHAADLHLGMRVTRFDEAACNRIGEARFAAIEQLRAAAIKHQVHFVLIAGDVFDDHDPLTPGGVWDREPWKREQPTKHVNLLREAALVMIPGLPVTLFPCPLRNRNSIDDPTAWIANHPRSGDNNTIRIGLAHGSLNMLPNLPLDDHLIRKDTAEHYGLDYLALGHWHKPLSYPSSDGVVRTAYSGTHEPMRFPGSGASMSTGWASYSADGDGERFQDEGKGSAMLVTIDGPCAPPKIEKIEVGRLRWASEQRDLTSRSLGEVISEFCWE